MATFDQWTPSKRMQSAATAERERTQRHLRRLEARRQKLVQELAEIDATREGLREQLVILNRLVQDADPRPTRRNEVPPSHVSKTVAGPQPAVLRGARVRQVAVRALAGSQHAHQAVHYRTWFDLLVQQGFIPAGKDPLATFLTEIGRSPVVRRSSKPGIYSIDFDFPGRAREDLGRLRARLRQVDEASPDATVEGIATARQARAELRRQVEALERSLEEAILSLGLGETSEAPAQLHGQIPADEAA